MKAILVKFFTPQRKLEQVVAELPELLAQPAAVLAGKEVRIGPMNIIPVGLAAIFICLLLPIPHLINHWDWRIEQISLAVGVALAIVLWFLPRGEIRLTADGVVFQQGRHEVRCPWALFNTPGSLSLDDRHKLTLPVSSAAVPYVELWENGYFRAQGATAKTQFFRFLTGDTLSLRNDYEAYPAEIGELLLRLSRMLGSRSPSGWVPHEALPAAEVQPIPVGIADSDGTIALSVTRLAFPPICCACGQATNQWRGFRIGVRWGTLLAFLGGGHIHPPLVLQR